MYFDAKYFINNYAHEIYLLNVQSMYLAQLSHNFKKKGNKMRIYYLN